MLPHGMHTSYRSLEGRHGDPGPGTGHDFNGALDFIRAWCMRMIRAARPGIIIEAITDCAFFQRAGR